jgi:hypothetical protein
MAETEKAAKKTKARSEEAVEDGIRPIPIDSIKIKIVGDSPLITHAWSEKAKLMMLNKQTKKETRGKTTRDTDQEYIESLYWISPKPDNPTLEDVALGRFGFPAQAFKLSAVDAGYQNGLTKNKTILRSAFHIEKDLVRLGGTPIKREDMVRIGMGTADLRYRAEFLDWHTELDIVYNIDLLSPEQIINLFTHAGFSNGVGEWRPARGGKFGRFHVEVCK